MRYFFDPHVSQLQTFLLTYATNNKDLDVECRCIIPGPLVARLWNSF